jgi:asparagine synthase (glutamine-hydrolysing)
VCGIAGAVRLNGAEPIDASAIERMLDAMVHRGPDGRGVVVVGRAALGAVRLAVRDPSEHGAQPMATTDGRHHLVHNGEVYDVDAHRRSLRGPFVSRSDTEVLLHLLARDGDGAFAAINGMFASAWWDAVAGRLVVARDRFGEKPLFWARHDGCLWFASEEKALFAAGVPAEVDPAVWPELLLFRSTAGTRTAYAGVHRLLPGHRLEVCDGNVTTSRWHVHEPVAEGDLAVLLSEAVARRLEADVPVGLFLSGGIDSASVTALAVQHAGPGLQAFTMSYPGHRSDEADRARAIAAWAGVDLHEVVVDSADLPALLEEATWLRGEPLALSAGAHMLALAKVARDHVTVVLTGEGSDELLAGYARYRPFRRPRLTTAAGHLARPFVRGARTREVARLARLRPSRRVALLDALDADGVDTPPEHLGYRDDLATRLVQDGGHPLRHLLEHQQATYLHAVLTNADRSTMGVGLEARAPFLDRGVADRAAAATPAELYDGWVGKAMLRKAMVDRLPADVLRRPKRPWSAPWQVHLREVPALRGLVRSLPTKDILDALPVSRPSLAHAVDRFLAGDTRESFALVWAVARISLWHDVCVKQQRGVLA